MNKKKSNTVISLLLFFSIVLSIYQIILTNKISNLEQRLLVCQRPSEKNESLEIHKIDFFNSKDTGVEGLHQKIILRQYYNKCAECTDSIMSLTNSIQSIVGKENSFFIGGNFELPHSMIIKRVYQNMFEKVIMNDRHFSRLDSLQPPQSYLVLVDTTGNSDFYVLDNLNTKKRDFIVNDIKGRWTNQQEQ